MRVLLTEGSGLVTLVRPSAWRLVSGSSVDAYAITPQGWAEILARAGGRVARPAA